MKPETEYTFPTVHLNGTNGKQLLGEYEDAADRLQRFIDAWQQITCNPRDYYVKGPEAFDAAAESRSEIALKIHAVKEYLEAHMIAIHDQIQK